MTSFATIAFIGGVVLNFLLVYLAYLLVARKQCTHGAMLKSAGIVALGTGAVTALIVWQGEYLPWGCDLIAASLLIYHCGRSKLKTNSKKAIIAACVYIASILILGVGCGLLLAALKA